MISTKWQRRAPKYADTTSAPGKVSRLGARLRRVTTELLFQSVKPSPQVLPDERHDNGPFGRLGPNTAQALKHGASAVGRTVSAPFGALITVTIADGFVRVITARGNKVRAWAESELPAGVVQHGLIVDEQTFLDVLSDVIKDVTRNGKLNGQKVAVAITGRNMVQRRLTVFVEDDDELAEAIITASSDSMSIRTEEMHIAWDAEQLDLIEEDEELGLDDGANRDADIDSIEPTAELTSRPSGPEDLGLENLSIEGDLEPDGDPYDVYALALHKHVIRRNLRTVSEFSTRFAGVQPKILALAAAVNSPAGVVLDIESNTLITAVVSNGLPEVIREVGLDSDISAVEWENIVTTQVSRAVAFYDSIFPDEPLGDAVEVFLTGETDRAEQAVVNALEKLPYIRAEMPRTLRAPEDFPFEKYAANVGLVIVSGKRFWQRAPVPLLPVPKFDYRPDQYRPRPLPVAAVLKIAVALILGFGIFTSYQVMTVQSDSLYQASRTVEVLEVRSDIRTQKLAETQSARLLFDSARQRTERLIAANEVLQDRDAGFADTVIVINDVAPSEVQVTSIDDDGRIVAVRAESADYPEMLAYIRLLEDVPQFVRVQVSSLGRETTAEPDDDLEPSPLGGGTLFGGTPDEGTPDDGTNAIEQLVEASLVITRIEIDDSELLPGDELAAAGDFE